MKPKSESWNDATVESSRERGARRSLTRVGLGQLTHVVSGALSTLQGGSNARASAQNRMKALLNQDRALLSHRACGEASLLDQPEIVPEVPRKGSATRSAAQNRMRELLNQDRAMLAFRARQGLDVDDDLDEALDLALKEEAASSTTSVPMSTTVATPTATASSRMSCVGVTTSFAPEESVSSVCTPGPVAQADVSVQAAAFAPVVQAAPAVQAAPVVQAAPAVIAAPAVVAAPAPAIIEMPTSAAAIKGETKGEDSGPDPIRTRGMAKLLALQGYRDRALSIYDELLAAEPNNADLRAEADRLRGH